MIRPVHECDQTPERAKESSTGTETAPFRQAGSPALRVDPSGEPFAGAFTPNRVSAFA